VRGFTYLDLPYLAAYCVRLTKLEFWTGGLIFRGKNSEEILKKQMQKKAQKNPEERKKCQSRRKKK
jgi:hypothetical protein